MLDRGTGTTEGTKRTQRLVLLILLCLFGSGAYSFYVHKVPTSSPRSPAPPTTSKPGKRTADHLTRFAYRNRHASQGSSNALSRGPLLVKAQRRTGSFAQGSHADQITAPSESPSPEAEHHLIHIAAGRLPTVHTSNNPATPPALRAQVAERFVHRRRQLRQLPVQYRHAPVENLLESPSPTAASAWIGITSVCVRSTLLRTQAPPHSSTGK